MTNVAPTSIAVPHHLLNSVSISQANKVGLATISHHSCIIVNMDDASQTALYIDDL